MAIIVSLQENINLLLILGKLAFGLGAIAIALLLLFWFRLKKIEKRLYIRPHGRPKIIRSKFVQTATPKTQVHRPKPSSKVLKKTFKYDKNFRWQWFLAILVASIIGIAIAMLQMINGLLSPEYSTLIWLCIGIGLVISAAYIL
jgi:hypothetical protein